MDQTNSDGVIAKMLRVLLGNRPYFGIDPGPMSRAESVASEAAFSPKSVAEVSADRTNRSEIALEKLRHDIQH